jgi:hypothetical protein
MDRIEAFVGQIYFTVAFGERKMENMEFMKAMQVKMKEFLAKAVADQGERKGD